MTRISATFRDREDKSRVVRRCFLHRNRLRKVYLFRRRFVVRSRANANIPAHSASSFRHSARPAIPPSWTENFPLSSSPNARANIRAHLILTLRISSGTRFGSLFLFLSLALFISLTFPYIPFSLSRSPVDSPAFGTKFRHPTHAPKRVSENLALEHIPARCSKIPLQDSLSCRLHGTFISGRSSATAATSSLPSVRSILLHNNFVTTDTELTIDMPEYWAGDWYW